MSSSDVKRVEYWHEWCREDNERFQTELRTLRDALTETQKKDAQGKMKLCLANFEKVFEYLNIYASYIDKDHSVYAYVSRNVEYMRYMCQIPGYKEGLMTGFYENPLYKSEEESDGICL